MFVRALLVVILFSNNFAYAEGGDDFTSYKDGSLEKTPYFDQIKFSFEKIAALNSRTPNIKCAEENCTFVTTMVNDDYRGNWQHRTLAYNTCLGKDGKAAMEESNKNKFWKFLDFQKSPDDYEMSYANKCNADTAEQQGHLQGKYLYFSKRMQLYERDLLEQFVISQHILGEKPLQGYDCENKLTYVENRQLCKNLRSCAASKTEMSDWVEKTSRATSEMDRLEKESLPARMRMQDIKAQFCIETRNGNTKCREPSGSLGEEYQQIKTQIVQVEAVTNQLKSEVPWVSGEKYREISKGTSDKVVIEKAIRAQLKANQPVLLKNIYENGDMHSCLTGDKDYGKCSLSDVYTHINQTPDVVLGPNASPSETKVIEIQQCLFANQTIDEKNKSNAKVGAEVASLIVGGYLLAPRRFYSAYRFISSARTAAGLVDAAAIGAGLSIFGKNAYDHISVACGAEELNLKKASDAALESNKCALTADSFKNAEAVYKSCATTVAVESAMLGLVGFQVARGLSGFRYPINLMKTGERARGTPVEILMSFGKKRIRAFKTKTGDTDTIIHWVEQPIIIDSLEGVAVKDRALVLQRLKNQGIDEADILVEEVNGKLVFSKWTQTSNAPADSLTGFIDRRTEGGKEIVNDMLNSAIKLADENAAVGKYTIYIELDAESLSAANAWSHALGDDYIRAIGKVMENNLRINVLNSKSVGRSSDIGIRIGGDEFGAKLTVNAGSAAEADALIPKIVQKLEVAANESPAIKALVTQGKQRLQSFRDELSKTPNFQSLNDQSKKLVEESIFWKAMKPDKRDRVINDPEAYGKFISQFAAQSQELSAIERGIDNLRFGVSGGAVRVEATSTVEGLQRTADQLAITSKSLKASDLKIYPNGKPDGKKLVIPESATATPGVDI